MSATTTTHEDSSVKKELPLPPSRKVPKLPHPDLSGFIGKDLWQVGLYER
jgi:hypothetical protein